MYHNKHLALLQAVFVIPTNDTKEALKAVLDHFGLTFDESSFLTRCGKCNGSHLDFIAKEKLANDPRVPPKVCEKVLALQKAFVSKCQGRLS